MGEEEARTEVGDVVANGCKSPEKVEKDVTDNEDQTGVKAIVEDNTSEGKVDANEKINAEKIDECKEDAEKENKPKEKVEEEQEAINEAIEEEKGSDEVKQEEDKKDEKGDVSEEKMNDVEESKVKMDNVEESKVKMDDLEESKVKMDDLEESKVNMENVEESKEEMGDLQESKDKMDDVDESKEEVGDLQESKDKMDDVDESKEEVGNVEKNKEEIDDVEERKEEMDDVKEGKKEMGDVQESKDKMNDVDESKEEVGDVEKSKEDIDDVEECKEEMDDVKEGKEEMDDVAESKEEMDVLEESKQEMDGVKENEEENGSKKRKRGKSALEKPGDKAEETEQELKTPTITNRPVRERKSVERLVAVIEKDMYREFHVEKGRGTRLKDIPNVAYKLSRRKGEDTFKLLHTILFGRRGKADEIKSNISRFSGFVWRDDEEKQKMKVKEKLDKCIKEKLLEICDVLDIPIAKSIKSTKKDDIVAKLIDFLLVPHATTTVLLAEKEQSSKGKKRGRDGSASRSLGTSPKRAVKSRKKSKDSKREVDKSTSDTEDASEEEDEEAGNGVPERSEDEISENSESKEKNDASEESEEDTIKAKKGSKRNSAKKYSADKGKNTEITTPKRSTTKVKGTPKRSSSNPPKVSHDADTSPKVFSRKKKNDRGDEEKAPVSKRSASKEKSGKRVAKEITPSEDELRKAVSDELTLVDFNTVTFKDILKELSRQFNTNLSPRKAAIKLILQDEIAKLVRQAQVLEQAEG